MKYIILLFVGLFAFTSTNVYLYIFISQQYFLRDLAAALSVSAVTFEGLCVNIPTGYDFSLTAADASGSDPAVTAININTIKLVSTDGAKTIATQCNVPQVTNATEAFSIPCTTTGTGLVSEGYKLQAITNTPLSGTDTLTIGSISTTIGTSATYAALGDNTESGKTIEKNAAVTFTIKFASGLSATTKPKKVMLGTNDVTDKCSVTDGTTLTCTIAKDVLTTEATLAVKITNNCDEEEDTGFSIKVGGGSEGSSAFITNSKIALLLSTLFFF